MKKQKPKRKVYYRLPSPPRVGEMNFHCSIRLDMEEMTKRLSAPQIHAVMHGIAQVLSAKS